MFSCEVCEISKNTFFTEQLWATASEAGWFLRTNETLDKAFEKE